ncbi:MAG: TraB domain-containing protein, partial [Erysipelotrichaceae bacterium]|nr:TraB domain-containing protein [Erysipelotrichaceae bacterium]
MIENNLTRLPYKNKEIILIATAHVSKESAEQVKEVIAIETPDSVCIELDKQRYDSLDKKDDWQKTDVIKVIKEKKVFLLLVNMLLSAYQRKIASNVDTQVGKEMIEAIASAKAINAKLVLADRDIQTTFMRIWRKLGLKEKLKLLYMLIFSSIEDEKIDEAKIEELKGQDMLDAALKEVYQSLPTVAEVLIDERNQYIANKIKNAHGNKIVAVLGAAHVSGVIKEIDQEQDMKELVKIPNKTLATKIKGWIIPGLIIAL